MHNEKDSQDAFIKVKQAYDMLLDPLYTEDSYENDQYPYQGQEWNYDQTHARQYRYYTGEQFNRKYRYGGPRRKYNHRKRRYSKFNNSIVVNVEEVWTLIMYLVLGVGCYVFFAMPAGSGMEDKMDMVSFNRGKLW